MSERVICIRQGAALDWDHYEPDPEAPPLSEVVAALGPASYHLAEDGHTELASRLDALIASLEGEG